MKFYLMTAQFIGGPFTFGLRTPEENDLDKKVTAVVYERYQKESFAPGSISFTKDDISEGEFNNLSADIKWDSNELEALKVQ